MFLGANLLRTWLHYACPGASHSDKQHGNVEQPQSNVVAQCSRRCRVKCKTGGTQTFVATRRYRLQKQRVYQCHRPGRRYRAAHVAALLPLCKETPPQGPPTIRVNTNRPKRSGQDFAQPVCANATGTNRGRLAFALAVQAALGQFQTSLIAARWHCFLQWGWRMASFCEAETIGKHTSKQKHGIKRLSGKSDDWGSGKAPRQDCVARI